jgi:hypothetical protein
MTLDEKVRFGMMALVGSAAIVTGLHIGSILGVHVGLLEIAGGAGSD